MKTNLPSTTLLHRFQAFLATLLLGWLAVSAHAAQPRIVFHEIVNPGAGKLVHSLGSYPAMSGNGNLVVYSVSRPDSQLDLFAINTDGTGQHSLGLFPHNAYRPAISYNGALAVLWNNSNLYTLNTTFGTPVKVLTMNTPGVISSIAVNDDGTKFYFTISADDYIFNTLTLLQAGVWEMNPDGSGRRLVTGLNAIRATLGLSVTGYERVGVEGGLAVSFNNRIVFPFMSNFYTGMHHIMSVNADGTGLRAIGPLAYSPSSVTISRDGSKVAFDQYSPRDLNTVNWDGTGHVVQVVPAHAYDPLRLTDNGSHLALVDRILRSDGGGFRSLRSGTSGSILAVGSDAPYLQLSADGRKICSVKNFGNTSTLVMIELDPDNLLGAPDITNTAITPGFVVHNNGTQATVTAQATYSGTPNSAFVYANLFLNGLPDPIFYAPVGTLFDDATNGDAVAGNGLFTANNFHFGYPTTSFGPRVVRFVTENTINGLRHATMVDHEPFFVLAAAPSGSAPVITSIAPDPGTAGGIITINGSNFGITRTGNVVTLGGYSCYVLTANGAGTQLTAEVPRFFLDGSYSAVVSANGQSSAPFAFSIGTAVPEIAVEQPAGTGIADGGSKDFGSVNTGANTSLIFTIKNTGNANLTGLTITKDGAHSADFTVTANPTAPVSGPSGSTTFTVQFAPGDVGARTAVLHIANNDSNENPYDITLTGIGTSVAAPEIAVEQPAGTNIADGGSKDFGSVSSGSNASLVFTIKNTGNSNLTGLTITKDGTHSADFTVTANPTAPVTGPSGSTTFTVQFAPGGIGARTAALHIANNDGDENPFDITLTGTGTAAGTPEIVVEQPQNVILNDGVSTVAWGSVAPGAGVVKSFTVRNTGTGSLNLSDVTKDGPNAADFSIGTLAGSLAAGDSTSFSVTFNPSTLGVKSAVLHILSNDADENPFDINLTGIGLSQAIFQQGANDPFTGLSYTGSQDVWLYINGPSTGTESRNTGADVRVITGGIPSGPRRALMRFDLASLAGRYATIHKVTLRLHWQSNSGAFAPVADSLRVYRVASANGTWVEGDGFPHLTSDPGWSTWSHRIYSSTPWAGSEGAGTAGTDYVNTVIGSKAYNLSEVAGTAFDIVFTDTSFINDWVAGNNSGLFLRTITENGQAIFHSSESTTAALRPELLIDFTPSGAPELDVEQPAGASLADGGNKDFGSVSLGATSSLTFTLKNSGDQNLTGLGITIDGAEASDFTVTAAPVAPVSGPGGSTTFTVQFAPGGAGQRTAALHIASNDADENPFDIILRGTGIGLPEIVVEYPFGVSLTDGSSTVAWGNSAVGTPVARTFILKNTGSAALNLTGASVDGANAGDFTLGALAGSIPAGGSVNLSVTFNASSVGAKSAALHLLSNDADESPFDIILTGNSRFETIYQQGAADPFTGKPYTGMEDTWLFTNGPSTGTESRNTGADERIVAGGIPDGPRHALLRFNVASLAGKFTSISKVTLRLYWRSNSAAFASVADTVQVFRVSAANKAWVEGNGFSGDTASAGWSTWGHRLHATTPWAGSVGANTPGTDYASTPLGTRSYDLSEVAGDAFEVVFTDTSFISEWLAGNNSGLYLRTITENGQANFHSSESTNAALRPQLLIEYTPVTGSEILVEQPAGIPLSDGVSSIDFGHLNTGTSVARTFIIRNLGSANLTGLAITKNGAHATNFTVGALGATSLAPGASTTFEVTFNPSAGGVRTAAIHIASNDANEKAFDIALMGIGIAAPEITVEQPANTSLVDGTSSVAFGNIALGKFSTLTFTIRNQGAVPLTGIAMTKDGANSGDFTITGPDVTALAPAASKTFTVKFTPGAATLRTAAIHITSNDDDEAVFDIALTGTGVIKPVVNPAGPFSWFVSGTVTDEITAANHPTSFTITGLPAAMTYDKTTGQLSGKPNAATTATKTFTVVASNIAGSSSAVTFSYTVTALPVLSMGTFNGLIDRSTLMSGPVAGQMLKGHGGSLSNLVVTSTGTFTATLNLEEKGYKMPAAARLDAATGGNPTASVVILRGTAVDAIPDLTFAFAINKDTGELTGTLSDGVIVTPVALKAWRSPWKATGTVASPANPATAASYTAALELDPALAGTDPLSAPPGNPANVIYPQGTGYVTLTITTAGVATWNGKAADGTPLTASTMLGPNGEVPLHFLLYTPMAAATAGSLHGWTKITGVNLDSVAPFDWLKLAQLPTSTTRSYKDGFPLHSLTVIGSKYVKPTAVNLMLGLLVPPNNAQLVFSEGGIKESTLGVSGALTQIFSISATNVISGLVGTPGVVTLTPFSATTGAISGNFTLSDDDPRDTIPPIAKVTRSTPWTGVLVPRLGKGVGQFQLAKLPTNTPPATTPTNSPQLSGQVVLEAP